MLNSPPLFARKLLPALIASTAATTAFGQAAEVISDQRIGTQSYTFTTTSILVESGGEVDASMDGQEQPTDYDDAITLSGTGSHALTSFIVEDGATLTAGYDVFYSGDEPASNTIGSISIAGDLFSVGYIGGSGVSIDAITTVTGNVNFTSSGSFDGSGTVVNSGLEGGVEQGGVVVTGTVNGNVTNAGEISATNGLGVYRYNIGATEFAGRVDGNVVNASGGIINAGTTGVDSLGGLVVMGGASVGGNVQNDGDIFAADGASGIRITSRSINIPDDDVDGLTESGSQAVVGGSVINNGTIDSTGGGSGGIVVRQSAITGVISNTGTIIVDGPAVMDGYHAIDVIGSTVSNVANSGTVTGGVILENSTVSGALTNTGTIQSAQAGGDGVVVRGTTVLPSLVNDGIISGEGGVIVEDASANIGNLFNSGEITGSSGVAIAAFEGGSIASVYNTGTINGSVDFGSEGGAFLSDGGSSGSIINATSLTVGVGGTGVTTTTVLGDITFNGLLQVIATAEQGEGFVAYGQLSPTGNANLTGATVQVLLTPGSVTSEGDEFSFVSAGGTLTSDATVANGINIETSSQVLSFTIEQRENQLFAIAGSSDFNLPLDDYLNDTGLKNTQGGKNLNSVADSLNAIALTDPGDELGAALSTLQSGSLVGEEYALALSTLDPDTAESSAAGAMSADTAAAGTVGNRQSALRGSYGFSGAVAGDPFAVNGFWVQAYDNQTDQDVRDGIDGFDADTFGFALGMDAPLGDSMNVGAAFTYADTEVEGKIESNEMQIESFRLAAYGSYNAEDYYVDAQVGYAMNQYETDRYIYAPLTGGSQLIANGDHDGDQYSMRVRGGYPIATEGNWFITPKAELDYTYLDEDSYTETGAGNLGLEVDTDAMEVLIAGVGVTFAYPITTEKEVTWIPEFSLDYMYDFIGDEVEVDSNFIGVSGAGFITNGASSEQEMIKASLRLRTFSQGNFSFSGGFDYIVKQDYDSQSLMATVRYDF